MKQEADGAAEEVVMATVSAVERYMENLVMEQLLALLYCVYHHRRIIIIVFTQLCLDLLIFDTLHSFFVNYVLKKGQIFTLFKTYGAFKDPGIFQHCFPLHFLKLTFSPFLNVHIYLL